MFIDDSAEGLEEKDAAEAAETSGNVAEEKPKLEEKDAAEAAKTSGNVVEEKPNPKAKFQDWLTRNHTVIPFPAISELEKLLDEEFGK